MILTNIFKISKSGQQTLNIDFPKNTQCNGTVFKIISARSFLDTLIVNILVQTKLRFRQNIWMIIIAITLAHFNKKSKPTNQKWCRIFNSQCSLILWALYYSCWWFFTISLQQTVNKYQPSHDFLQNSLINQKTWSML